MKYRSMRRRMDAEHSFITYMMFGDVAPTDPQERRADAIWEHRERAMGDRNVEAMKSYLVKVWSLMPPVVHPCEISKHDPLGRRGPFIRAGVDCTPENDRHLLPWHRIDYPSTEEVLAKGAPPRIRKMFVTERNGRGKFYDTDDGFLNSNRLDALTRWY